MASRPFSLVAEVVGLAVEAVPAVPMVGAVSEAVALAVAGNPVSS